MQTGKRIRVLHVLATVGQGGVETWLSNLLPRFDRTAFQFDVCFYRKTGEELKDRLRSSACSVFEIPLKDNIAGLKAFVGNLRQLIRHGNYDVVHCHGVSFVGVALYCAWREGVAIRIAHSHGTSEPARSISQTAFLRVAKQLAQHLATHRIGCSTEAAEALFGAGCLGKDSTVLYCGVDIASRASGASVISKESLGISQFATTIGCVANFTSAKNHAFLLALFARILQYDATAHLILVGDGQNKSAIENQAVILGITNRVHLLGRRIDVVALLAIFDVFVLPSLTEGLPLALLEAQANGVPCITSTAVTREAELIPGLVKFLPLTTDLDVWASTVIDIAHSDSRRTFELSRRSLEHSPYNIDFGVSRLGEIYRSMKRFPSGNSRQMYG